MTNTNVKLQLFKATLLGGFLSAIVKFGWEVPFPPRTPERDATNPPQTLLEQLGLSKDISHYSYLFNENTRPIFSFIVHFGFSFFFAWLYYYLSERNKNITFGYGALYGILVYILFHIIIMPLLGTIPAPWDQPWQEHLSELFGHIVWAWSIEVIRVYVKRTA
ncbi:YagU family protein [Chryseobacterium sp. CT-SW4]|uniref:YagU family protein n=1 Tax=Chryseobacterium sp. SW-1 TaxID=3157343 RepID=UPI003B01DBBA